MVLLMNGQSILQSTGPGRTAQYSHDGKCDRFQERTGLDTECLPEIRSEYYYMLATLVLTEFRPL